MDHDAKVKRWKEKMVDLLSDEKIEAALDEDKMSRSRVVRIYKEGKYKNALSYEVCGSWFSKVNRLRLQLEDEYECLAGTITLSPVARSAEFYFKSEGIEPDAVNRMLDKLDAGLLNFEVSQPVDMPEDWERRDFWH